MKSRSVCVGIRYTRNQLPSQESFGDQMLYESHLPEVGFLKFLNRIMLLKRDLLGIDDAESHFAFRNMLKVFNSSDSRETKSNGN
jgi:hypothetical protein